MNLLIIGAGRMGMRHLVGAFKACSQITIVDPKINILQKEVKKLSTNNKYHGSIIHYPSIDNIPINSNFDAGIISSTANGRKDIFFKLLERKVYNILLEKPIEQSRKKVKEIVDASLDKNLNIRSNHPFRELPLFQKFYDSSAPFHMAVVGGAFGLACNGIHWIDLAVYLSHSKDENTKLLFSRIDKTPIKSGRGEKFVDYGGTIVLEFARGSILLMDSWADSSAPLTFTLNHNHSSFLLDRKENLGIIYERNKTSTLENYLYGFDYERNVINPVEAISFSENTTNWLYSLKGEKKCFLPKIEESVISHERLFDALETTGKNDFFIT